MRHAGVIRQIACGCAALSVIALIAMIAPPARATHDSGLFELDGNATASASAGDDWSQLFPTDSSPREIARVFVSDAEGPDASYFTGGGSKDQSLVADWAWTSTDLAPDKDEITDAFAAAYLATTDTGSNNVGDLIVTFGLDRFANNGDAEAGFWFFRGSVSLGPAGAFSGAHTVGDILVLSEFTGGGSVATIEIYRWVGSGGSDGSLDLIAGATECASAPADDQACAVSNTSPEASPWSYTPKAGAAGTFPTGTFFEGAINVTRLVPGLKCLKSFMGETRSSSSIDAQLKDLALGPFDTCPPPAPAPTTPAVSPPPSARPTPRGVSSTSTGGGLAASGANLSLLFAVSLMLIVTGSLLMKVAAEAQPDKGYPGESPTPPRSPIAERNTSGLRRNRGTASRGDQRSPRDRSADHSISRLRKEVGSSDGRTIKVRSGGTQTNPAGLVGLAVITIGFVIVSRWRRRSSS